MTFHTPLNELFLKSELDAYSVEISTTMVFQKCYYSPLLPYKSEYYLDFIVEGRQKETKAAWCSAEQGPKLYIWQN